VINNNETDSTITKKRNRKRPIKLQGKARKRCKNKPPNSAYYNDDELTFEIKIRSINRDPEAARAKIGTLRLMEELHTDSIDGGHEASYGARSRARERAYSNKD
jgi:hypothetical protein